MKKTLTIALSFLFLITLASCRDKQKTNENTSSVIVNNSTFLNEYTNTIITTTQHSNELSNNKVQTDAGLSENNATNVSSSNTIIPNENSAPQILFLTLDDIATVEDAYNNMDEEEFKDFISEHPKHYEANGITNRSDAKKVIDELKETTVILLDGDTKNVSEMYFYLERNEIQQSVSVENEKRIICTYYTPQKQQASYTSLTNNQNAEILAEMSVDDVPVKMYQIQNNDSYFAELTVNNTTIFCRITNMENVDELKACFSRLTFVKIGDLLNK